MTSVHLELMGGCFTACGRRASQVKYTAYQGSPKRLSQVTCALCIRAVKQLAKRLSTPRVRSFEGLQPPYGWDD